MIVVVVDVGDDVKTRHGGEALFFVPRPERKV
jgi:hypothetical protein